MGLYYVTGTPGVGKSAVRAELQRRGYEAHETDDLAAFYDIRTGQKTSSGQTAKERTPEWRKHHQWKIPPQTVAELARASAGNTVFLCGVVANDAEFWDLFTRVFCLYLPPSGLEQRLTQRPDAEAHGKNAHELANTLAWASYAKQQYTDLGAVIIDAAQPLDTVVDEILGYVRNG